MMDYASKRTGRFGLYLETGQGADFTNGHGLFFNLFATFVCFLIYFFKIIPLLGYGFDMVVHEARKYGFARAMKNKIGSVKGDKNGGWVVLNDVSGFIGPEVFKSKEQLLRVCLEDTAMGKRLNFFTFIYFERKLNILHLLLLLQSTV